MTWVDDKGEVLYMKIRKLFIVPLLLFFLAGCNGKGSGNEKEVENNAALNLEEKTIIVDETFVLSISNMPEGITPKWSLTGDAVTYTLTNDAQTLARVQGAKVGNATISAEVGKKTLSCAITVNEKPLLPSPVLTLNENQNGLTWDEVPGSTGYIIQTDDGDPSVYTDPGYLFVGLIGEHTVSISAKGDIGHRDSAPATFTYTSKVANVGALSYADNRITWASWSGLDLLAKKDDADWAPVTGDYIETSGVGEYCVQAVAGWEESTHTYCYKGLTQTRVLVLTQQAASNFIVEDGSADDTDMLREDYTITYYDNSWKPSTAADVFIDNDNAGFTDGNCVKVKYYKNGNNFKFAKKATFTGSYDSLSVCFRGDDEAIVKLQLKVTKNTKMGGVSLSGIYATFTLGEKDSSGSNLPLSSDWKRYNINMNDDGWRISVANQTKKPSEVPAALAEYGAHVTSFADLITYFDEVSFLVQKTNGNNQSSFVYLDDYYFSNEHLSTSTETLEKDPELRSEYAIKSYGANGRLDVNEDGITGRMILNVSNSVYWADTTLSINSSTKRLTVTSTTTNRDFVLVLESSDFGDSWSYVSCTGTLATILNNASFKPMILLDDFSYTGTGTGYDSSNTNVNAMSGLRQNYYCDFYSNDPNDSSPVGGTKWSLMGSNDYMDYTSTSWMDNGGARLKCSTQGRNMRYMTFGLARQALELEGEAESLGKGYNKLSVMVKGGSERDINITMYAYYMASLSPATQQSNRSGDGTNFTVAKNSNWNEYTIDLEPSKVYYGVAIIVKGDWESSAAYLYIDDMCMYNTNSPFVNQ